MRGHGCCRRQNSDGLASLFPTPQMALGLALPSSPWCLNRRGAGSYEPIGLAAISAAALAQGRAPHPMLERLMSGAALVVPALQERGYGGDPLAPGTQAAGERAERSVSPERKCSFAPTAPKAFWSAPAG